jgi:hypothetical protein
MRKSRVKELMPKSSFTLEIPRSHQGAPAKELVPKSASKSSSQSSCQKALVQRAPTKELIEELSKEPSKELMLKSSSGRARQKVDAKELSKDLIQSMCQIEPDRGLVLKSLSLSSCRGENSSKSSHQRAQAEQPVREVVKETVSMSSCQKVVLKSSCKRACGQEFVQELGQQTR